MEGKNFHTVFQGKRQKNYADYLNLKRKKGEQAEFGGGEKDNGEQQLQEERQRRKE